MKTNHAELHQVMATSFADPIDIWLFKVCKKKGKTDRQCFKVGDNGIGCWGDDTTADRPMCALPPEDWKPLGKAARGALVEVTAKGRTVVCELRDTMPSKANVENGAGIDLNPAACKALGLKPPIKVRALWRWAAAIVLACSLSACGSTIKVEGCAEGVCGSVSVTLPSDTAK